VRHRLALLARQRSCHERPAEFIAASAHVDDAAIQPLPRSRKAYFEGSRPDLRVPMRLVEQSATPASFGAEPNPPVYVYDTSGPYTDPQARIDIRKGLPALRARWIEERGDTVELDGPTSLYGQERLADAKLAALRFDLKRRPIRAKPGATSRRCTTRAAASSRPRWSSSRSARTSSGSEYLEGLRAAGRRRDAWPSSSGASTAANPSAPRSRARSRRSSCATRSRAAAPSSRRT
jgi:phosphomethylpyrimidine synthase